ncbi:hypothetical protein NPIL_344651 [Nephila pilipes]|uniref:Uncharacterized protein n=1 Tax=Nephila pilipes TaxID=299642 RepID=A0A8X6QU86_NEPPI|nr:hypothetical protein NPIL_344651 [Nephila pilipes]
MGTEKMILPEWIWCVVRFVFFRTYKIVFLPSILLLLDLTFIPSEEITPVEDACGCSAIDVATQEDIKTSRKSQPELSSPPPKSHDIGIFGTLDNLMCITPHQGKSLEISGFRELETPFDTNIICNFVTIDH